MKNSALSRFLPSEEGSGMREGFTLIELAIVLVIIGLLIGGLLVAQSLIGNAKLNAQIKQFQQYDIIVSQFKNKYNQLPGDSNLFDSNRTQYDLPGNNDGFIQSPAGLTDPNSTGPWFVGEVGNFWYHLSQAGMMDKSYDAIADMANIRAVLDGPEAKLGTKGSVIFAISMAPNGADPNMPAGTYWILCLNGTTDDPYHFCKHYGWNASLTGEEALAIDTKMDDGIPFTGSVLGGGKPGFFDSDVTFGNYNINCAIGEPATPSQTRYNVKINGPSWWSGDPHECMLHVKMFSIAGDAS